MSLSIGGRIVERSVWRRHAAGSASVVSSCGPRGGVYVIGVAIVRLGKSRLIGRSTSLDVILGFILGSLLSRGITGHASISGTAVRSAALVAMHWWFTAVAYVRTPSATSSRATVTWWSRKAGCWSETCDTRTSREKT